MSIAGFEEAGGKSLRIVHVCSSVSVESGGVSRAVLDSMMALAEAGAQVTVLSHEGGIHDFPWKNAPPENLRMVLCRRGGMKSGRWASREMRAAFDRHLAEADVLHLHGMWEPMAATAAKKARARGIPYVCSIHGMLDPWSVKQRSLKKRVYYALVERRRLGRAAALHFTAEQERKKAAPWISGGVRTVVLPVMMELAAYRHLPERDAAHSFFPTLPRDRPWILFLSRIHEKKGLDVLIDAVAQLRDEQAQLVIAGAGEEGYVQEMRQRAQNRGIGERTHFVGVVRGETKVALYRRAQMLVLPTSQENFGLVFPEAMACETPVLLTTGVDIYQEVIAAGAGALISRDPADVAKRMDDWLSDAAATRLRGEAGRRWVFATLEPAVIARQWLEVYNSL